MVICSGFWSMAREIHCNGKGCKSRNFFLDYPIDLVQVVARCGGLTEWANLELTVVREGAEKKEFF